MSRFSGTAILVAAAALLPCSMVSANFTHLEEWHDKGLVTPEIEGKFSKREATLELLGGSERVVRFRLFEPDKSSGLGRKRLLVWLHGHGEAGGDNREHLRWMNLVFSTGGFDGYILAYQCPREREFWNSGEGREQPVEIAKALIDHLTVELPIDVDRVYLSGVSSGGTGCWELLSRYPHLFAAVVPLASGGLDGVDPKLFCRTPIWSFHCTKDPTTPIDGIRKTIRDVQDAGGQAYLTETPGVTHNSWTIAFEEYQFLRWLESQARGIPGPAPNWKKGASLRVALMWLEEAEIWYFLPAPIAAVVLLLAAWRIAGTSSEKRLRSSD